ncbi:GSCOCT00014214001.2-RA-CDS [Cotesia congregata]|uniref:Cc_bv17.2_27.5_pseudo n=1 Tax=Cotesia congregata TaxID=51543 RepID=A0A8J2HED7_COTCN|nr:GSCOCT00014214001.2-RA-CDS [Cotesia congregata]CAG5092506.1 cc_bv17.2_27.5_pseudo [Cotesia congregata]
MLSLRPTVPEFLFLIKNTSSSRMVHNDRSVPNKSSGRAEIK